ncbi:MAG: DoxX family protein [Phaeodactylibacter sp.]|nr:DoxX family protein [Phaeodactylibacter sp.]
MTLGTLTLYIAIAALVLTLLVGLVFKAQKNWLITYLQNFTGALFVFSGWVKAIDPLGTAYKMEQYFAEFEATFENTWFSFIAPMFPWLSEYAINFSVAVIIFEIVLGIMLLIGALPRLTAWLFFLLVLFFTALTGFTYLTGFVPAEVNFFQFGQWVAFEETNMKVTDCGCFGDFLKLKPKISFFKDLFLLIPALIFLWQHKKFHQLFAPITRTAIVTVSLVGLLIYCMSNYVWDLPHTDFRPFAVGKDVRTQKMLEEEAAANTQVTAYKVTNKATGETKVIPIDEYLKVYQKEYPKEEWTSQQISSKPEIEATKISDFEIEGTDGMDIVPDLLDFPGYTLMVVAYKMPGDISEQTLTVQDTSWIVDTVQINGGDSIAYVKRVDQIQERQVADQLYTFPDYYLERYQKLLIPIQQQGKEAGAKVFAATGFADPEKLDDFKAAAGFDFPIYQADDILLKTIVRSNPGLVLWKDGKIVNKWHHKKFDEVGDVKLLLK